MALVSAEKYEELAPCHCLPRGSGQGIVAASASTGKEVADVRFGVIRYRRIQSQCPLCQKRKNLARQRNDARGHKRTHAPQQIASLFNRLVGAGEYGRRNCETQSLRGLEIDDQLKLCGHLHWKVRRLSP